MDGGDPVVGHGTEWGSGARRAATATRVGAALVVAAVVPTLMVLAPEPVPADTGAPGTVELLSVNGGGSDGGSWDYGNQVATSGDGRSVAFTTRRSLDPADAAEYQHGDVYVRDRATGRTVLISRGRFPYYGTGTPPPPPTAPVDTDSDAESYDPTISADGRYVAFASEARNIAQSPYFDNYGPKVIVCDRDPDGDGVLDETLPDGAMDYDYVIVGERRGEWESYTRSQAPSLSADGSVLSWVEAYAPESYQPVVRSVRLPHGEGGRLVTPDLEDITTHGPAWGWNQGEGVSRGPGPVTTDAGVAYLTPVPCGDPALRACGDADLRLDAEGGPVDIPVAAPAGSWYEVHDLTASRDGRVLAFALMVWSEGSGQQEQVLVHDRDPDRDGVPWPAEGEPLGTSTASRDPRGQDADGFHPSLSGDGRYLAFLTRAPGMHDGGDVPDPGDYYDPTPSPYAQAVVRDLVEDAAREAAGLPRLPAELVSRSRVVTCPGQSAGGLCGGDSAATSVSVDGDGSLVAFQSNAGDLVAGDTNGLPDTFAMQFRPGLSAAPPDFGTATEGGTVTRTIVVGHQGFGPVRFTGITFTGADAGGFAVFPADGCAGKVLHRGDTCPISVRYTAARAGARSATAVLAFDGGTTPVPLAVRVEAVAPPTPRAGTLALSPDVLTFPGPRLALSPTPDLVVEVVNSGGSPVAVTGVAPVTGVGLFPGDYRVVADSCTGQVVQPGARCRVTVAQQLRGAGSRPGALLLTSDAPDGPRVIGLAGSGVVARLVVDPAVSRADRVVRVLGAGFPAGADVRVELPAAGGAVTARTDAAGAFSAPVVVLNHFGVGTVQVTASVAGTDVTATAPLLLVQGSFQPPGFTSRG
ncbi:choice-of-anchor D domain-containing protein [Actinokineospora bangkokensis]|uniref:Abnormal spindle-like microcephaly-associated protein ASH domain-containing protein n=1 Tax=Actinokineospora bangkokensis TaxID=1193682 RepID=A0A1Q9LLK2_9PSEU|nr:choice-of-anchor D domain-containing protein [Actinokineospora bangkokensis]OLR92874.1 hypothetical protein BJP25_19305 [Actinokineospora bangkokensis]